MKKTFLSFIALLWAGIALAQENIPYWENPEVFAVNKEATRTTAIPYPSEELAKADDYSASPFYRLLDGMWKFRWVPTVAEIPTGFEKEGYDISGWSDMPVPGNWEFNGYGTPMYVNLGFGFRARRPATERGDSPVGAYRHTFDIPEEWDGRRVFIHFDGGTAAMYVWVNGQSVGYTENAKSPAEFDITPYIRKGQNTLACEVHRYSDGTYQEDQDMWRMGGISRSVYLYSTAQTRIADFFAHPDLDKNYRNGVFSVDVTLKNYAADASAQTLDVAIVDKGGKTVLKRSQKATVPAAGAIELTLSGNVSNPLKWTAETPDLYTLVLTLKDASGKVVESTSHKIGFRKVEITDGQLLVNGKKVYFKGVNLHEFNTNAGNVVTREVMMRNLQLMKELNINAVRTSHYPQPPLWYRLCDEYGIYLVDEANQETHGLIYGPDNVVNEPEWFASYLDRMKSLIERDKNHASVVTWSLGNESGNGEAFYRTYDWAKARDNSRPVQYEQAGRDRNTDIICPMYPSWGSMVSDARRDLGRPYIMCEYAHAMGNSMGNFQEYWDLMRSSKNMQGGFIWEWYNHGYPTEDEQGRFYWAYGGDLGGYGKMNDGNFCMDGIISPDQNYLPHTHVVKKVYQDILFEAAAPESGVVTVINDFKFMPITPEDYDFRWVLLKNGEKAAEGTFTVSIPADGRKDVALPLPAMPAEAGTEYFLQIFAHTKKETELIPAGFEAAKGEFAIVKEGWFTSSSASSAGSIAAETNNGSISVTVGEVAYTFSTRAGRSLQGIRYRNRNVLSQMPSLNFWHAPTDNEFGEGLQRSASIWSAATNAVSYTYKNSEQTGSGYVVRYEAKPRGVSAVVDITYTVNGDGSLTVTPDYRALGDDLPEMLRFGMRMSLSGGMNDFTWYGRGPWENYIDRNVDTFMGIWNGKVGDQHFEYYRPQETGNKTDVRWLTLRDSRGAGIKISGAQPLSVSATYYRQEDLDPGTTKKQQHWSDVVRSGETILCVDLFQRGVGGLQSWGAPPLDEYRFRDKEYSYSYTISVVE